MKTVFLIFAIVAIACAYAVPIIEDASNPEEGLVIEPDELAAILNKEFADEKFLEEEFQKRFDINKFTGVNTQLIAGGKWMKYIPWGVVIDAVVEGIKKATE